MTTQRITKEQLKAKLSTDYDALLGKIADAINKAELGAIIDQSEEPVRDANALFRERAYQEAISLLDERAFSPSKDNAATEVEK
jgi:hypothetical protein